MNLNTLKRDDYFRSTEERNMHPDRSREIIKKYPEIANLIGRNPWTFAILVVLIALQFSIAAYMGTLGLGYWWLAIILAWVVGAFANHNMYVVIHETTHNMVFKSRLANRWTTILADLANGIPGAQGFSTYHLRHHAHMGEYENDTDIAGYWEAKLIGNSAWRKAMWLLLFPLFQIGRTYRIENVNTFNKWVVYNIIAVVVVDALMIYFFGWNAIVYMVASMFFALGLHPLGARWVQEHYTLDGQQETHSYYGSLNNLNMNIGYHVEHHDFPAIPWNKIKHVKAIAPEYYDTLKSHNSWTKLWLAFIFNPQYSLFSRTIIENGKEKVAVEIGKSSRKAVRSIGI